MADAHASSLDSLPRVEERSLRAPGALDAVLDRANGVPDRPFIMRGLVADWPLVAAAKTSPDAARAYLAQHARPLPFTLSEGRRAGDGRLFYDSDYAMNFSETQAPFAQVAERLKQAEGATTGTTLYLSSVDMRRFFNGLVEANPSPVSARQPLESIWIGTATKVAAHNDFPRNLACCVAGRRRFVLFPPDQLANLYLGPLDNTPAGRPVSMVDADAPDFETYPRFAEALQAAQVAELEPGDAIYIPSLWWHQVEALAPFNILVNYWWRDTPAYLGQPQDALHHAILAVRDLPPDEKAEWRRYFDRYVFDNPSDVTDHLPPAARGILAPLTAQTAGRLRTFLLRSLNR